MLQVAQQAHRVPRSLLPAGHPHGQHFQLPALGYLPGSENGLVVIGADPPRGGQSTLLMVRGSKALVTLYGECVSGTTIHPIPLPIAMPSASPSTHPAAWKAKLVSYILPYHSCPLVGGTLPGMQFGPKPPLRALHPPRASPGRYHALQALHRHHWAFGGL